MGRIAKIARLPWKTREELNFRLRDGESGPSVVSWLNGLPEVKEVLEKEFQGVPVSEQNLSAWRNGDYEDWLARQDEWELSEDIVEEAGALKESLGNGRLTEGLSAVLASKLGRLLSNWRRLGEDDFEQELKALRVLGREVARLRKGDHTVVRLELKKERQWNWMETYSTKQFTKMLLEWARKDSRISSWLRAEWPDADQAARYFWKMMKVNPENIDEIMAQPDKVPPWEKEKEEKNL